MRKLLSFFVFSTLVALLAGIFLSLPRVGRAAGCSNTVVFAERARDRFSVSPLVTAWKDFRLDEVKFVDDCFDATGSRIAVRLVAKDSSLMQVVFFVDIDDHGNVPLPEVQNIVTFSARAKEILSTAGRTTRVLEYQEKSAARNQTIVVNASFDTSFFVPPLGSSFSGLLYSQNPLELAAPLKLSGTYLLYEIEKGSVWYRLPMSVAFSAFPESQTIVKHYKEAARAVSQKCSLTFTPQDAVLGVVSSFITPWNFRVESTLSDCPPRFEETFSAAAQATVPTQDLKTLVFETPQVDASFQKPFPYGIMTTLSFRELAFRHLRNILAILIMVSGALGFFVVIWHAVVYPPRSKSSGVPKSPPSHSDKKS